MPARAGGTASSGANIGGWSRGRVRQSASTTAMSRSALKSSQLDRQAARRDRACAASAAVAVALGRWIRIHHPILCHLLKSERYVTRNGSRAVFAVVAILL